MLSLVSNFIHHVMSLRIGKNIKESRLLNTHTYIYIQLFFKILYKVRNIVIQLIINKRMIINTVYNFYFTCVVYKY